MKGYLHIIFIEDKKVFMCLLTVTVSIILCVSQSYSKLQVINKKFFFSRQEEDTYILVLLLKSQGCGYNIWQIDVIQHMGTAYDSIPV